MILPSNNPEAYRVDNHHPPNSTTVAADGPQQVPRDLRVLIYLWRRIRYRLHLPLRLLDSGDTASTLGSYEGGGSLSQAKSVSSAIGTAEVDPFEESEFARADNEARYFPTGLLGCSECVRMGMSSRGFRR